LSLRASRAEAPERAKSRRRHALTGASRRGTDFAFLPAFERRCRWRTP